MNRSALFSLAIGLALVLTGSAFGQITLLNQASSAPSQFVQTVGTGISIDTGATTVAPPFPFSTAYARRDASPANSSYLPTGYAVNPTSDGSTQQNAPGYTIQFWLADNQPAIFGYLFGDGANVSPLGGFSGGAFRCFKNGTGSTGGNMILRGIPNQTPTTSGFLNTGPWNHCAVRYDAGTNMVQWVINGVPEPAVAQVLGQYNWSMGNLAVVGANNTGSAPADGGHDDLRIYDWARSDADIAADFMTSAMGTGVSGESNIPDMAYFDFENSVLPHNAVLGSNGEATSTDARIVTDNTLIEWGGASPGQGGLVASALLNFEGISFGGAAIDPYAAGFRDVPSQPISYSTAVAPSVTLGHNLSSPPAAALAIPDGINLKALGVVLDNLGIGVVPPYQYMSPNILFPLPGGGTFSHGDVIRWQFVAPDGGYPGGIAGSNQVAAVYSDCMGNTGNPSVGPHCHVEARGAGSIQVAGFFEIHNTGNTPIGRVTIDLTTATGGTSVAAQFLPAGALNTGGTLNSGTSYRRSTEIYTGLDFANAGNVLGGYTEIGTSGTPEGLQFDFMVGGPAFDACIDSLIFDCDIQDAGLVANLNGDALIGATVTVIYADGPMTTVSGQMVADPNDSNAAIIDF